MKCKRWGENDHTFLQCVFESNFVLDFFFLLQIIYSVCVWDEMIFSIYFHFQLIFATIHESHSIF